MPLQEQRLYEFGPFQLDPTERRLLQDGKPVPLTPKAFQTLLVLVQNQSRVVEKEDLLKKVWPDTYVEEATLAQNVFTLRKQLGNDRSEAVYIETVPKRGYRFVAPVKLIEPESGKMIAAPSASFERQSWFARRSILIAAGVLACVLVGIGIYAGRRISAHPRRSMLAVLPVQNLTGRDERNSLSDGLTEEIIAQMGVMDPEHLGVIARTSSMAYKDSHKTVDQIGRELNVDFVLEASLRDAEPRTRVTAQLIDARSQARIWAEDFDVSSADVLGVEDEIGRAVASEIHLELQPRARQRLARVHAENPEARRMYVEGRYYWNLRTREGLDKALTLFKNAAEKDPTNARVFAGLADTYNIQMFYGFSPGAGSLLKAKAAAQRAIELDDTLAEGHAALAYTEFMWLWQWAEAEKEFRRAIAPNHNYATAHHWFAMYLSAMGRHGEALEQINQARVLDPVSLPVRAAAGLTQYYARNYDLAIAECRTALAINSEFAPAHTVLGHAYVGKKMFAEAEAEYQKVIALTNGAVPLYLADLGYLYGVWGKPNDARKILEALRDSRRQLPFVPFTQEARVFAGLNQKDEVVDYQEKAQQQNDAGLIWLGVDPRWDGVRSDPKLKSLFQPASTAQSR